MFGCLFRGHVWQFQFDSKVFEGSWSTRPLYVKRVYQCTRCLKTKKVKM